MANLSPYSRRPASLFSDFERQFNELLDDMWGGRGNDLQAMQMAPLCDVTATDQHYFMSFDMPGVKKEDIKVEVNNNRITVSGERQKETVEGREHHVSERSYGRFSRSVSLPQGVDEDHIEANFENGVLTLTIPKTDKAQARRIEIKERSSQGQVVGESQQKH